MACVDKDDVKKIKGKIKESEKLVEKYSIECELIEYLLDYCKDAPEQCYILLGNMLQAKQMLTCEYKDQLRSSERKLEEYKNLVM